jgi:hypothetical protein
MLVNSEIKVMEKSFQSFKYGDIIIHGRG